MVFSEKDLPFDLYARFRMPQPMGILLILLLMLGLMGAGREKDNRKEAD